MEWIQILKLLDLHGFQILYQTSEINKHYRRYISISLMDRMIAYILNYIIYTRIDRQYKTRVLFKQLKVKTNQTSFYVEITRTLQNGVQKIYTQNRTTQKNKIAFPYLFWTIFFFKVVCNIYLQRQWPQV